MFLKNFCFCRSKHASSSQKQYPTIIEELCHKFSLSDLRKSTNNFDHNRVIGRGAFSTVYKGCLQHNNDSDYTIAVKRFDLQYSAVFNKEIELLCQLRHPNIVSLIGFCNSEDEKILVYEYMSNGSFDRHLLNGKLSWKKRLKICIGVARGLHYLHTGAKRSIFHCILRASTILLGEDMEPKLTGFGVSVQGPQFNSKPKQIDANRIMGTLGYMPLEYLMDGAVTDKWDVYSFGLVLLSVVCGMSYLMIPTGRELLDNPVEEIIDSNIKGMIAPECWQVFIDIMIRCLEHEQNERPAMGEVELELEHAMSLQEQADITHTYGHYTLLSKSIIPLARGCEMILQYNTEDSDTEET